MRIMVKEVADADMPEGHDWAVVRMAEETWLLTRRSPDVEVVNQALAEVDCA